MNKTVEAFLNDVWEEVTAIYARESKRILELKKQSRLQAGINDYLQVAWRKGKFNWAQGSIHIDVYQPFSWSDSSYKIEAGAYIEELTDELLTQEFSPALCRRMDTLFQSDELGPRFFDYRFDIVFVFEREQSELSLSHHLLNETKLVQLEKALGRFIQTKIMSDPPVLPSENDMFFFARHLINPDLMKQEQAEVEPLIRRLSDKLHSNRKRLDEWTGCYTSALKDWAQEHFLNQHFVRSDDYSTNWILRVESERQAPDPGEMDFFLFAALEIGGKEPHTRQRYLELAVQLDSGKAADYLKTGSGKFESVYKGKRMEGRNNDVTQTIDIRILSEEQQAYEEALDYLIGLLRAGFPKGYKLKLQSGQKHFLPLKKLAKSKLHQFFGNALQYPLLFPKLAEYAETAMEEFSWYEDVEPGEKSVMPGTYAVFGLGLCSESYFPLVCRYMKLVDTEHQMVQDSYAEAFVEAHGVKAEHMPVLVAILLGGNEEARLVKNITIDRPELAHALVRELENKKDYEQQLVLCRIFGSAQKLAKAAKKAEQPLKGGLEQLLRIWE
ncbi:DUF6138 family protein [Paenibacillus sp. P96]|uniref:DUF6138 family protein n=1 Tax=Paenibacillus zeirhizosphaerae TaxID=2987519 RepID=A0ABT9FUB7_9BACL|nr:DUF6138 family protein [Paenibacillus sp. P96]MDP4098290.1 DUF6138 family protein [Paenibacillus sp. P96]